MALPAFLTNRFAPLDFSSISGFPNHVSSYHEWNTYFARLSGKYWTPNPLRVGVEAEQPKGVQETTWNMNPRVTPCTINVYHLLIINILSCLSFLFCRCHVCV